MLKRAFAVQRESGFVCCSREAAHCTRESAPFIKEICHFIYVERHWSLNSPVFHRDVAEVVRTGGISEIYTAHLYALMTHQVCLRLWHQSCNADGNRFLLRTLLRSRDSQGENDYEPIENWICDIRVRSIRCRTG